jgi:hypothetical protein
MTIIALAICVVILWREVGPLRAEVARLRNEVGILHVDDPKKIHVIRVNTRDELTWKWRVWLPAGVAVSVRVTDNVSPQMTSSGSGWGRLDNAGENVIEFRIDKDRRTDQWNGTLYAGAGSVGKYEQPWVGWKGKSTESSGVGYKTKAYEPGNPINLISYVVTESAAKGQPKPKTLPSGFKVWIETK